METKANHVLVGLFALVVTIAAFAFVYWLARLDETSNRTPIYVVFDGSVSGLNTGSSVLYNGIKVGEVSSLEIIRGDPKNLVRALLRVDAARTPLKQDTKAQLEYQGLTGVAAVQLFGGSFSAPDLTAEKGQIPTIFAEKGQFQDLMDAGRAIVSRASEVLDRIDRILGDNETSINTTLKNVETFTGSLARNSDNIDKLFADANQLAERLNSMSGGFDELVKGINSLVGEGGGDLMKNIGSAFKRLDTFLAENGPDLQRTVANLEQFTTTLTQNRDDLEGFIKDARATAGKLSGVSDKLDTLVGRANEIVDGDGGKFVKDAGAVFARLDSFLSTNQESLGKTVNNVEKFTGALAENSDDISTMLKDASNLAAKLSKTSDEIDALVQRVDGLVAGDGTEFMSEAKKAAQTFRQLAENLDERIGTATEGISRVTGRGFKEFEAFVVEGRSTLRDIKRILDRMERNPQRFFFGRTQVPEYQPR